MKVCHKQLSARLTKAITGEALGCELRVHSKTVTIKDVIKKAHVAALNMGLLTSQNQKVALLLDGIHKPVSESAVIWSTAIRLEGPKRRLRSKTDLSNVNLNATIERLAQSSKISRTLAVNSKD